MEIKGKTALITGGAARVGKAISLALARAGANVVVHYNASSAPAEETAVEARALGVQALTFQADVSEAEQVQAMMDAVLARFGGVDILVNAASWFKQTPFPSSDLETWRKVTSIVIDGALYCSNAVAPGMIRRGEGVIINILDLAAWEPWHNFGAHSVAKAGLHALSRQLAMELAPHVRVNAVAPGPVLPPEYLDAAGIERVAKRTLLGRWGLPDDVAEAVLYLVRANYVTGSVITVDGGESIARRK